MKGRHGVFGDTAWASAARRERRLHFLQLAVIVLAAAGATVAVAFVARSLASAEDAWNDGSARLTTLYDIRDGLREANADFWEARTQGRGGMPVEIRAAAIVGTSVVDQLVASDSQASKQRDILAAVTTSTAAVRESVARYPDDVRAGSAADLAAARQARDAIEQLDRAADAWLRSEAEKIDVIGADAGALGERLVIGLGALLGGILVVALGGWAIVNRYRGRVADELAHMRDARAALLASMRDGLVLTGPDGAVEDVNPRFLRMTGFTRDEIVGSTPPLPYWPVGDADAIIGAQAALPAGGGEFEAYYRRADGDTFPAITTVAPRHGDGQDRAGSILALKDISARERSRYELQASAAEQAARRRVATAVAATPRIHESFEVAATEIATLLDVEAAVVLRFADGRSVVMASHGTPDTVSPGFEIALGGPSAASQVFRTGRTACVGNYEEMLRRGREQLRHIPAGQQSAVGAPIWASGSLWGCLVAAWERPSLPDGAEGVVERFAEILGIAVANSEARAQLESQAASDPLTRLANHRVFHERLAAEAARAVRYGRPLALAIIDLDHFKEVNDAHGHQNGDDVLAETGRRLGELGRPGDVVARIGGEEFGWIMPEASDEEARELVERARRSIAATAFGAVGHLTASAGIAHLAEGVRPDELVRFADGALYWAKLQGRDVAVEYTPDVVKDLSVAERSARLEREQALAGLRGLARAVDAKDPSTRLHSERVATLAGALADELGWPLERCAKIREAGLLHDVGKIGVPDAILFKRGRLNASERAEIEEHASLGAEIVGDILSDEQAAWIRHHHERIDGAGYPWRLADEDIPLGARILAVADAWDVITSSRSYSGSLGADAALHECRRCAGTQFDRDVVAALGRLHASNRVEVRADTWPDGATG